MYRQIALLASVAKSFSQVGEASGLFANVVKRSITPPFNYGSELYLQVLAVLRNALTPLLLTAFALSMGPAGIQSTNVLKLFGAEDRLGGVYVVSLIREFAPIVSGLILAGVAGTAVCADLGARRVREEIEALEVLGLDTIRFLIVPRVLALLICSQIFVAFSLVGGMAGAIAVVLQNGGDLNVFFKSFVGGSSLLELQMAFLKTALFGFVISVVCCYMGQNASGGAAGVAQAVNKAVVICFVAIGIIDYAFTQFILALNPQLTVSVK